MKIEYTPTENDLLTHQLFVASQSKRVKKRRAKGKIFLMLIYMTLGLFIWERSGPPSAAAYFVVCLPLYFVYAFMEKKQYVTHFRHFVHDQYKDRMDTKIAIELGPDQITLSDGTKESVVPLSNIETIYEIGILFSIFLKNGQSLLIPKEKLSSPGEVASFLHALADQNNIPYQEDLKWKWS